MFSDAKRYPVDMLKEISWRSGRIIGKLVILSLNRRKYIRPNKDTLEAKSAQRSLVRDQNQDQGNLY